MKNILLIVVSGLMLSSVAYADANKGKKLYMKKMKASCGFSGGKFATKHTQDEWEKINDSGLFSKEISKICPGFKLKDKYIKDLYDFSYEYASDSGNVPSC